jgi:GNAT superfamily N-acetyltransferase
MTAPHAIAPRLIACSYTHPHARLLLRRLHHEQHELYGFADDPDDTPASDYTPPSGLFIVATLDTTPVACGGWRRRDAITAEIKRMYTLPALRGYGLGSQVLRHLENDARRAGFQNMLLETGRDNYQALRLYATSGYTPTSPYITGRNPVINRALRKSLIHAGEEAPLQHHQGLWQS